MTVTQPGRRVRPDVGPEPTPAVAAKPPRPPHPAAPPPGRVAGASIVSSTVTMVALVCLWMAAQLLFLGGFYEARQQHLLYDSFRTQLASETAPIGPTITEGDAVAVLKIPSIDLQQVVIQGTTSQDLLAGPGHERNTVLPGQVGSSYVLGKAATYGGPFRDITQLKVGATIQAVIAQGTVDFTVIDVRRAGDPSPQPLAAGAARITLVTAEGSGTLGGLEPTNTVYVDAVAAKGLQAPPMAASILPAAELPMGTDPSCLPLLVLHLALMVGLTIGIVAARQRWSAVLVWVVASPLALALAWSTTDVVMRLLPNLT